MCGTESGWRRMPPQGPRSGGGSHRLLADGGNHGRVPHGARGAGRRRRQAPDVVTLILSFVLVPAEDHEQGKDN